VGCTYLSYGTEGGYDCDGHHPFWAMDLLAASGTDIYPAGAGFAQNVTGQAGFDGYGNTVVVDHGNNVKSLYAHMSVVLVGPKGEFVTPTTVIGLVGETGDATTPHLHFEITSSGQFGHGSRDPGPLQACHGSQLITYPQAWGLSTWQGIPWGTHTGYSDGTGCTAAPTLVPDSVTELQRAATVLVAAPTKRKDYGFLGLGGAKVTYSVELHTSPAGTPITGATAVFTTNGKPFCSAVTDTTGTAVCHMTYSLFNGPSVPNTFSVTYAGNASYVASTAVGSDH
jgi:Peptidase family M23